MGGTLSSVSSGINVETTLICGFMAISIVPIHLSLKSLRDMEKK